ncbi:hypothetical protein SESBI_21257 [Sesbania bispinosa]|nr:hypothetical protein SESBI_21257 [Sesbania bispinosa]
MGGGRRRRRINTWGILASLCRLLGGYVCVEDPLGDLSLGRIHLLFEYVGDICLFADDLLKPPVKDKRRIGCDFIEKDQR